MKKRIRDFLDFICMVVLLGLQNLLSGSWSTGETSAAGGERKFPGITGRDKA